MKSLGRAVQRHPEIPIPNTGIGANELMQRFAIGPTRALHPLLIAMGPFVTETDAFHFPNKFPLTEENGQQIRRRFQNALNLLVGVTTGRFKTPLDDIDLNVSGVGPKINIPDLIKNQVLGRVAAELIGEVGAKIADAIPGHFGRCGGMAFAGYDLFLHGFPVDERLGTSPPSTGPLSDYIFERLLDSLELNVVRFVDLVITLHLLPVLGKIATVALLAAAGSVGGIIGAGIGALIGTQVDIFHLGGPGSVLDETRKEWPRLKRVLDQQAAVPIGLIFGSSSNPIDQHSVLAIGYRDADDGTATLTVWDNNDANKFSRFLNLDFRGSELQVVTTPSYDSLQCFFVEEYVTQEPPQSLKLN
jgi:hypothetical protein